MKKHSILLQALLALGSCTTASAQLYVGSGTDMLVKAGTTLAVDSLSLIPSADLDLLDNTISHDYMPVTVAGAPGIARVYHLSQPISFTGEAGLFYAAAELNGNTAALLQLARYDPSGWTAAPGSASTPGAFRVSNVFSTTTGFSGITAVSTSTPLPIRLFDFTARKIDQDAALSWAAEADAGSYFLLEHSADGTVFTPLQRAAAEGAAGSRQQYSALHAQPGAGPHHYRIKLLRGSGAMCYSMVRSLYFDAQAAISLSPNPARGQITLTGVAPGTKLSIVDAAGRQLMALEMNDAHQQISVAGLLPGAYHCRLELPDGRLVALPFVKL